MLYFRYMILLPSQAYGKSNLAEQLLVTQLNLSELKDDMSVLRSCIDTIVGIISPLKSSDPSHVQQSTHPLQPQQFGTSEDVQRMSDWAVSLVKLGLKTRDEAIQVSSLAFRSL